MKILDDARFARRAALMAAYSVAKYGTFELAVRLHPTEAAALLRKNRREYGRDMLRIVGAELKTRGIPDAGFVAHADASGLGRMFICNHRSGLDILVTAMLLEGRHLSRADLGEWPLIGRLAHRSGALFVDRSSRRSSAAAVQSMITAIQHGDGIILFPEGTTYAGDEVRPFKPGAYAVAKRTECELVAVGLAYAGGDASFDDESFMEHMRRVTSAPHTRLGVSVGTPERVDVDADPTEFSERLRARVAEQVKLARALVGP